MYFLLDASSGCITEVFITEVLMRHPVWWVHLKFGDWCIINSGDVRLVFLELWWFHICRLPIWPKIGVLRLWLPELTAKLLAKVCGCIILKLCSMYYYFFLSPRLELTKETLTMVSAYFSLGHSYRCTLKCDHYDHSMCPLLWNNDEIIFAVYPSDCKCWECDFLRFQLTASCTFLDRKSVV